MGEHLALCQVYTPHTAFLLSNSFPLCGLGRTSPQLRSGHPSSRPEPRLDALADRQVVRERRAQHERAAQARAKREALNTPPAFDGYLTTSLEEVPPHLTVECEFQTSEHRYAHNISMLSPAI